LKLHCFIARLAYEPTELEAASRGSCSSLDLFSFRSSKSVSIGFGLQSGVSSGMSRSGLSTPASESPITPMFSAIDGPSAVASPVQKGSFLKSSSLKSSSSLQSPVSVRPSSSLASPVSVRAASGIRVTVSSLMSPQSSSSSPKEVADAASSYGKRHSQYDTIDGYPKHRHRHHHQQHQHRLKKSSIVDTN